MLPQKILKTRGSEMQFPTFWTSNRVVFMKTFVAIWRLFSVKKKDSFTSHTDSEISEDRKVL